jgi:VIT1/CCC1 family predicted Fe2+/Mn2+ transporter
MIKRSKKQGASFVRNFIFGVEDSLVSTVGLVSGIAVADVDRATIFLTGMVLIVVEALSMGVGSILSESATEEFIYRRTEYRSLPYVGGAIMFVSYFVAGFIPLVPYVLFEVGTAFPTSIALSLASLFLLGFIAAKHFHAKIWRNGIRMLVLGGLAIIAGSLVGRLLA